MYIHPLGLLLKDLELLELYEIIIQKFQKKITN